MRKPLALWITLAVFGLLLWLSSIGVGTHPTYRLVLLGAMLSWCGWFVAAPRVRGSAAVRL